MSLEHIILLFSTLISLIGVLISFFSVRKMGKQVEIQKKQWEYSSSPIFQIIFITGFDSKSTSFVIENTNRVYHQIEGITFSTEGINVTEFFNGTITSSRTKNSNVVEKEDYHGLIVTLSAIDELYHIGMLQIVGKDMLGNRFKVNSTDLVFKNFQLDNHLKISKTYLKKI